MATSNSNKDVILTKIALFAGSTRERVVVLSRLNLELRVAGFETIQPREVSYVMDKLVKHGYAGKIARGTYKVGRWLPKLWINLVEGNRKKRSAKKPSVRVGNYLRNKRISSWRELSKVMIYDRSFYPSEINSELSSAHVTNLCDALCWRGLMEPTASGYRVTALGLKYKGAFDTCENLVSESVDAALKCGRTMVRNWKHENNVSWRDAAKRIRDRKSSSGKMRPETVKKVCDVPVDKNALVNDATTSNDKYDSLISRIESVATCMRAVGDSLTALVSELKG